MTIINFLSGDSDAPPVFFPAAVLVTGLGDFAVRRLAPLVLEVIAAEIETCGRPMVRDWPQGFPQTVGDLVAEFRQATRWCESLPPITDPEVGRRVYDTLDNVRRLIKMMDLDEQTTNRLQHLLISCYLTLVTSPEELTSTYPDSAAQALRYRIREIGKVCLALKTVAEGAEEATGTDISEDLVDVVTLAEAFTQPATDRDVYASLPGWKRTALDLAGVPIPDTNAWPRRHLD